MTTPTPPDRTIGPAQQFGRWYRDSPKLRGLVEGGAGAFPVIGPALSALSEYIVERLNQLDRQRVEQLFKHLDESGAVLTSEMIESDDFLHRFTITIRAARKTHQREKIRLLSRLLASSCGDGEGSITDVDDYEEILGIIEDMSIRELRVIVAIDQLLQGRARGSTDWNEYKLRVANIAGVPEEDIDPVLVRLMRTGLYAESIQALWGGTVAMGELTARWYRLRSLIADADGKICEGPSSSG